ncbi:MAG: molybdopterin-dependent oxidoreductase, partial [Aliifodinibius sp.]|nr:molybdopterin-dependent oxidoreductase [Fodinibius sp.]NIV15503.1 molybdopterin-dependent oxidoreductase [Fodinibius sp.]NIY29349.1 molybdopterin-dependent oxidoreductase [Fodinibius sp.]
MNRRDFLKFIGMASGATVLSSCGIEKSTEKIIPRIIPPEDPDYIPGEPMFRNSTCTECPAGCGTTVRIVDFNPIKLEGVENHPLNDGALCVRGQSSLMRLYHPERLKTPLLRLASDGQTQAMSEKGFRAISWDEASQLIIDKMQVSAEQGKRNTYLSGLTNSSLSQLIDEFCGSTNVERLTEYETFDYANLREANRIVFGRDEIPAYKIEEADFLLTLGADIIETFITPVNHAVQLKKAKESHDFRWFHIEPHVSMTGFKANRKMTIRPGGEIYLMVYLVNVIITNKLDKNSLPSSVKSRIPQVSDKEVVQNTGFSEADLEQITQALINSRNPLLIAGGVSTAQSTGLETAVLAGQVQWMLGMTDTTIDFGQAQNLANLGTLLDVQQLSDSLSNNEIGVLFVTRSNPLATVPGNLGLNDNFPNADFKVAFSDFVTETAAECDLILPLSHSYESWGDVQPHKGLTNVIRPVIKPLYQTETEGDILIKLSQRYANRQSDRTYEQWLKEKWTAELGQADMEKMIERGYHRTEMPPVSPNISAQSINRFLNDAQYDSAPSGAVLFALPSIR